MSGSERPSFTLSARKRALLEKHLDRRHLAAPVSALPRIEPRTETGPAPLSFAQERMWFAHQLDPSGSSWNAPRAIRLRGPLRTDLIDEALSEVVRRHESLRTTFRDEADGERGPVQMVGPVPRLVTPVEDLSGAPDREARVVDLANEEARRPFDLATGPLLRTRLILMGPDDHVLLLNLHHIVSDGWSAGLLVGEIAALYEAIARGVPSPLPELPVQYADFAIAQRLWLRDDSLETQRAYWRKQLDHAPPLLQLPADRPRPAIRGARGAHRPVALSPALSSGLKALARQGEATLFMTLLAAFQTFLHRLTGRNDVPVGTLVAHRDRVELERLIGFFGNTLVLRGDLSGDPTFRQLLARVRETTLSAWAHQDLPFERVVEDLAPVRDASYHPLFQVMLLLQPASPEAGFADLSVSSIGLEPGTSRFDLALMLEDGLEGIAGTVEYDSDLFDEATVDRWAEHFATLLEGIVRNPEVRLSGLPMLTGPERRRLLVECNPAAGAWPVDGTAQGLFEAQAARTPDAVAAVFADRQIRYGELNAAANRVARRLQSLGVGRGSIVAIHLDRSLALLTAVLGTLKAGAACLSLDPSWPKERLAFMLSDSGARVLLTEAGADDPLVALAPRVANVRERGDATGTSDSGAEENPPPIATAEDLAYVVYTSGSTGRPKGVAMPHRALVNLVEWHRHTASDCTRILQFAALSFDVSFQEIFSCFASGGTLLLLEEETRLDAPALGAFLAASGAQRAHLPNAVLARLAEEFCDDPAPLRGLREVMVGGEQLQITPPLRRLFEGLAECRLFNHYGPSETHVVTSFPLAEDASAWPPLPPLGHPIPGARLYVLDTRGEPVPIGVAGELFIGGLCVARGYLNRPDLTAERFQPDPDAPSPGARRYRTGDLARRLPDGAVEFLGRTDHQVKIRGLRIEPGEIESVLAAHPDVGEAVVVTRPDPRGDRQLVAYVVPRAGAQPTAAQLRRHLRGALPEYMVPSWFVTSGSFPRTPNGKIDRAGLPPPEEGREEDHGVELPRTPVEERIAAIWKDLLGLEQVGVDEEFFDLGGHSLLATRILSRTQEAFGVAISLRTFFDAPTIAALAETVTRMKNAGAPQTPSPEATGARASPIPVRSRGSRRIEDLVAEMEDRTVDQGRKNP